MWIRKGTIYNQICVDAEYMKYSKYKCQHHIFYMVFCSLRLDCMSLFQLHHLDPHPHLIGT